LEDINDTSLTLDKFLDSLAFSLADEFIRKMKSDEKPAEHIHLYGIDLRTLFYVSGKLDEYLADTEYCHILVSYNTKSLDGRYNLDIGRFLKMYEQVRNAGREVKF
jgi:hypothetical protein